MREQSVASDEPSVFQFLFGLAADARVLSVQQFLRRLVTGLANHYAAAACSIYLDSPEKLLASADPTRELEDLAERQQQEIRDIERQLAALAFERGAYVSALDAEGTELPPEWDVFAFPLNTSSTTRAVVVLFLDAHSRTLGEADLQALRALGSVLEVGVAKTPVPPDAQ